MRAYLVKDEGTLEMLASQKFEEDLQNKQKSHHSKGAISSIEQQSSSFGSVVSKGFNSGGQANSRGASSIKNNQRGIHAASGMHVGSHIVDSEDQGSAMKASNFA